MRCSSTRAVRRCLALVWSRSSDVLIEKSFTRNAAEAREVSDAARAAKVACLEAMWPRFLPRFDIVRQLLADGTLGPIETVIADHGQPLSADRVPRLHDPELAGGALLDLGIYPVSFAFFALGTPARVHASGTLTESGVDRQVSMVFEHEPSGPSDAGASPSVVSDAGAHALLSTTLAARTPASASIAGTRARIELDKFYHPGAVRLVTSDGEIAESAPPAIRDSEGLCFEAVHLAQLVADGATESPLLGLDETVAIMATLDDIRAQVGVRYPGE